MQAVKAKGSKIEQLLAKVLWHKGYRYRKNDRSVMGSPDFSFKGLKIAVFCDGEFWHGKDWGERKHDHKSNVQFWHHKIERNIKRDEEVNKELIRNGWKVLRFWGKEIEKDLDLCAKKVGKAISEAKANHIN